jgi:ERCC4-related helicase
MPQLLKSEKIESRTYQEVIAASAINTNTLVVLPTGLGKTVIAAMVAAQKAEKGKVMFLAPTKPLAEQHISTFQEFIDIGEDETALMTGDTRPDKRYKLWEDKKMFFGTPQVVENDLISNQVPVEEFSLVIFDEAHRATGDYSYVFISEKMPNTHKLALTASPGGTKEKIDEVAENLDIHNYEVRTEDDPDVEPYIEEKEVNWMRVSLDDSFEEAKKNLEKAYQEQLEKLKKNGQLDSTSNVYKGELLKLRGEISSKLSSTDDPKLYRSISHVAAALKISQAIELLETQGVSQCYSYIQGLKNDDSKAAQKALNNDDFQRGKNLVEYLKKKGKEHPKIDKLRDILGDIEDEKAIVFTEYRDTTEKIAEELRTEGLNATNFIGQQGEKGMTQTEQAEVLEEFEDGEYDVIVSTSIGEEGLDIPAVDYVVFYEPVASEIRDIQRAGRTGRQESGKVFVLIAENTRDEGNYWSAHHKKKKMNSVLQELKDETREEPQKTLDGYSGEKNESKEKEDNEEEIKVIADDRETSISKKLSKMDLTVEQERLDIADFLVSDRAAVERKQVSDFVDSIVDNRLFSQLTDLHQFDAPVIIIEGDNLYTHRDIHPNAIRGALASISMDHQIPILWTDGEKDTAETLASMAKREQEEEERNVAVRGNRSGKTEKELQKFVTAGLPDVNKKIAERLLEEFGSIEKVFTASEEELKQVHGIGDKKAEKIRSIVEADYNE